MAAKNNECEEYHLGDFIKRYYLPTMYGIIFIVGLVGNIAAIAIYLLKIRPFHSSGIIMLNLAVADLLYVLSLPFLVHYYNTRNWMFGDFMCSLVRFCFHFNLYGSIFLLTCFSVFRYVVVVHPLKAVQVKRQSWGIISCLATWFLCLILFNHMFGLIKTKTIQRYNEDTTTVNYSINQTVCIDFASNDSPEVWLYNWILTIFGFLVPLFVVCLNYICMAVALSRGPLPHRPAHVRARRTTVLILLVFVLCFTPYHLLRLARVDTKKRSVSCPTLEGVNVVYIISRPLAGLNTFFNLALYTLAGDRFRQAFWSLFSWKASLPQSMVATIHRPRGLSCNHLYK
ncbi:2-oxoglutarate receptor 1 [Alosa sapidissima]|uniref:2-oxoglutarate receptor 1 n=1 Tax=Alosa sapidissima TaxID=34773 RepID=UPI001C07F64E|nr:2-oxoglutarate receptor 1 [Alosa sapidissima]